MDKSLQAQLDRISKIRNDSIPNVNVVKSSGRDLKKNTVTKSNDLSRAYYRYSLNEKRVMEAIISRLHPMRSDNELQDIELSASDFAKAYGIDRQSAYKALSRSAYGLQTKLISSMKGDRPINHSLVITSEYAADIGAIIFTIHPKLVPHLIGMKGNFNSYLLASAADFKSSYTWRFYELLISRTLPKRKTGGVFGGEFSIDTAELRKILGVPDTYNQGRFKKSVLEYVTKELFEKADIIMQINPIKTSRTITSYNIVFVENDQLQLELGGAKGE